MGWQCLRYILPISRVALYRDTSTTRVPLHGVYLFPLISSEDLLISIVSYHRDENDQDFIVVDAVDESVFLVDTSRPDLFVFIMF